MKRFLLNLLGWMIAQANAGTSRREFYPLKDRLLRRFGTYVATDVQHIKKTCWACNGTGVFTGYDDGYTWHERSPEPCRKCTNGVYVEFWVLLARYRIGQYELHVPQERLSEEPTQRGLFTSPAIPVFGKRIEGYISHKIPKSRIGNECFWWLYLLFETQTFFRRFGKTYRYHNVRTPLVALENITFRVRYAPRVIASWWRRRIVRWWLNVAKPALSRDEEEIPF